MMLRTSSADFSLVLTTTTSPVHSPAAGEAAAAAVGASRFEQKPSVDSSTRASVGVGEEGGGGGADGALVIFKDGSDRRLEAGTTSLGGEELMNTFGPDVIY